MTTRWASTAGAGALAIAVAALVAGSATPAQAHSYLADSTPAASSVITEIPDQFSVTTNEQLLDLTGGADGFALQVIDSSGMYYGDGCLTVAGATLSAGAGLGDPGGYRVVWQVVSEDGHPVSGEFAFTWQPSDATQSTRGSAAPPVCGETEPTPTASATAEPSPTATAVPTSAVEQGDADLNSVLLVGGVIAALLGAVALTVLLLGSRSRKQSS
ncbi:MAG: copper resistance protein CopC [Rhodoglobus sp.]|nr:copper resistance protein CopC [Rhodoglobus sp.]